MDPKFNLKQITVMSSSRMIKRPAYSQEHPNDMCVWQAGQGQFSQQEMGHTRVAQCSAQESVARVSITERKLHGVLITTCVNSFINVIRHCVCDMYCNQIQKMLWINANT